jgi:hypothetical protein
MLDSSSQSPRERNERNIRVKVFDGDSWYRISTASKICDCGHFRISRVDRYSCLLLGEVAVSRRLHLGRLLATPGALAVLLENEIHPVSLLARHSAGDWGDLDASDKQANKRALVEGTRKLSCYQVGGVKLYIITEWDRSTTTIQRADEY